MLTIRTLTPADQQRLSHWLHMGIGAVLLEFLADVTI